MILRYVGLILLSCKIISYQQRSIGLLLLRKLIIIAVK